jgi:hypothetical protein
MATRNSICWSIEQTALRGELIVGGSKRVNVEEADVIWWRRVRVDQELTGYDDDRQRSLINNDCRGALAGTLGSCFTGRWVSSPDATDRASDKLYQLAVASSAGMRVPQTLVSQSADEVTDFAERLRGQVIVKPVVGVAGPLMFTQFLGDPRRLDPGSYRACPAVYQEYIPGTEHIRLNCFGDDSFAALIATSDLDWRPNLNVPIRSWMVPPALHEQVRAVLDRLGLEMGVVDLKRTPEGDFVWLEVNPQGQLLFLQPLTGVAYDAIFADYLLTLCKTSRASRTRKPQTDEPTSMNHVRSYECE